MVKLGVLFDWDGVVVNSAPQHQVSWELLAAEEGLALPAGHFKRGFGRRNSFIIPEVLGWAREPIEIERLSQRKEVLYREILEQTPLEPLPGVRSLLQDLKVNGVPCAVGSSTERENITMLLQRFGLIDLFAVLITAEDVSLGKPDPEVFLKAAEAINRHPKNCVVLEDSEAGLQAARAGGMYALGVANTHPVSELQSADQVVSSLEQVSFGKLADWIQHR